MPKEKITNLTNYVIIVLASTLAFIIFKAENLSLQITAFLIILYFASELVCQTTKFFSYKKQVDIFFLTTIALSLVLKTQAMNSPIFFLLYFLLFGVALLFEARASIVMVIAITLVLLATPMKEPLMEFLQIASLYLVLPLAHIFGNTYKKLLIDEEKIKILSSEGTKIEKDLVSKEERVKNWTSHDFSNRLTGIWQDVSSLLEEVKLEKTAMEKISKIQNELKGLLGSVQKLEKEIEK